MYAGRCTSSFTLDCERPTRISSGFWNSWSSLLTRIVKLADEHDTLSHLYADDTQLYASCRPQDCNVIYEPSNTSFELHRWCRTVVRAPLVVFSSTLKRLKRFGLGRAKTWRNWQIVPCALGRRQSSHQPSFVISELVYLDAELTMKQHVSKVAAACFYHLRRLRQIRRRVGTEVTVHRLVLALITSRLDCNSLLAGVPQSTLNIYCSVSRTLQVDWFSGSATTSATVWSNCTGCRSTGAYNINSMCWCIWNHHREVSWLSADHRPASHFITSTASFGGVPCAKVRYIATTHEVWRACLQLRRPSGVELTS